MTVEFREVAQPVRRKKRDSVGYSYQEAPEDEEDAEGDEDAQRALLEEENTHQCCVIC